MSDDRPKFIGVFDGGFGDHGPSCLVAGIGPEVNHRYHGTSTWAVDDRGALYQLCVDLQCRNSPPGRQVWVQVKADIVRNPNEAES